MNSTIFVHLAQLQDRALALVSSGSGRMTHVQNLALSFPRAPIACIISINLLVVSSSLVSSRVVTTISSLSLPFLSLPLWDIARSSYLSFLLSLSAGCEGWCGSSSTGSCLITDQSGSMLDSAFQSCSTSVSTPAGCGSPTDKCLSFLSCSQCTNHGINQTCGICFHIVRCLLALALSLVHHGVFTEFFSVWSLFSVFGYSFSHSLSVRELCSTFCSGWCSDTASCRSGSNTGPSSGSCSAWVFNHTQCSADPCAIYSSCTSCAGAWTCGWCADLQTCQSGDSSSGSCSHWKWFPSQCGKPTESSITHWLLEQVELNLLFLCLLLAACLPAFCC